MKEHGLGADFSLTPPSPGAKKLSAEKKREIAREEKNREIEKAKKAGALRLLKQMLMGKLLPGGFNERRQAAEENGLSYVDILDGRVERPEFIDLEMLEKDRQVYKGVNKLETLEEILEHARSNAESLGPDFETSMRQTYQDRMFGKP